MNDKTGIEWAEEARMLCAVLLVADRPCYIPYVRLAVIRGHKALRGTEPVSDGSAWGFAVKWMLSRGYLIEDLSAHTWSAGILPSYLIPDEGLRSVATAGWTSIKEEKIGHDINMLSGRPGHPGYDKFCEIAASWGYD